VLQQPVGNSLVSRAVWLDVSKVVDEGMQVGEDCLFAFHVHMASQVSHAAGDMRQVLLKQASRFAE
jgi:hypothetical protein